MRRHTTRLVDHDQPVARHASTSVATAPASLSDRRGAGRRGPGSVGDGLNGGPNPDWASPRADRQAALYQRRSMDCCNAWRAVSRGWLAAGSGFGWGFGLSLMV